MSFESQPAYYPLTLFDGMFAGAGIVMGWLVEGHLEKEKIKRALDRVVAKWPMLGGRLEAVGKMKYRLKVPLGHLPVGYERYVLSTRISSQSISEFVTEVPLPTFSDVLPEHLFISPGVPKTTDGWVKQEAPLTWWHLTYFEEGYTCIGVTFAHGLFDGMGIASVVHAVEAEVADPPRNWAAPRLHLGKGDNENELQTFLDRVETDRRQRTGLGLFGKGQCLDAKGLLWDDIGDVTQKATTREPDEYQAASVLWEGSKKRMILLPPKMYEKLVENARVEMKREGKEDVRLSTGDVLTAWLYKTIYSAETKLDMKVHLSNMASLRMFSDAALSQYAHNCFIPIPYPLLTVGELKAIPVHQLAYRLASARASLSVGQAMEVYRRLKSVVDPSPVEVMRRRSGWLNFKFRTVLPYDLRADESMTMSNMSIARIVDVDWRGAGSGRTVCRYKSVLSDSPITIGNIVTIAGRLDDGRLVLDVVLNRRRLAMLEKEVRNLTN